MAIVVLVVIGLVCVRLGFWQMHRAQETRTVINGFAIAATASPLTELPSEASDEVRYRPIRLVGHYVPEHQFLIDNIVRDGRAGYYVLTPFDPEDSSRWVIVNRGWVPAPAYRSELPDVPVAGDRRSISGRFAKLPSPGLKLGKPVADEPNAALLVLPYPTMEGLGGRLGQKLFGYQVELDGAQPDGFKRAWRAPVVMSPARHWGYAVQWWIFGTAAFCTAGLLMLRSSGWRRS